MRDAGESPDQLDVLVVDDTPEMRELLVAIIHREGHQAIAVDSAEKALELLPVWTFQIAFLDHNLPGMEGLLLGEYLRRSNPSMLIALVTGEDDPRLVKRTRELSVTFIAKPFDNAQIHRVLETYRALARERAALRESASDGDFEPPIARFAGELPESFGIPKVPDRITDRLVGTLKRSLANLRSASRYNERDRVVALSGLLAARVLDVELPRTSSGLTLFEEYDRLMQAHGRRTEFGA
ncbi:MAG: response regulator [Sandaracinaceae bacterium]|nr:response regulator [Sandaracinaceae bacterium]